jgi:Flp pilus assembly protein TadD
LEFLVESCLVAIGLNPQDHEAMFNAGVINEKLGQFDKAYARYDAAFKLKPQQQYIVARKRVKTEQTPG